MAPRQAQRLADAPLTELFPGITDESLARLVEVGDQLNQVRLPADPGGWHWYDEQVIPAPKTRRDLSPIIIGTTLTVYATSDDSLELALDVWQSVQPLMTVTATVEVSCWCETNHNIHAVEQREWLVGTDEGLVHAVTAAVQAVIGWLDGPREPIAWRQRAGLPNPQVPRADRSSAG